VSQKIVQVFFATVVVLTITYATEGSGRQKDVVMFALIQMILANVTLYALTLSSADHERERTQKMQTIALTDTLTGLANRLGLEQELTLTLAQAEKVSGAFALLFLDLDGFKAVNDTLGHDVGDALLREVAKRLGTIRRESDVLARLGGDEFVLLARGATTEAAKEITLRIQQTFRQPFLSSNGLPIGASVGYSAYPADGTDVSTLMSEADKRMYDVKRARKNQQATGRSAHDQLNIMDVLARLEQSQFLLSPVEAHNGEIQLHLVSPEHPTMNTEDIAANALSNGHHERLWHWWTEQAAVYLSHRQATDITVMPLPIGIMNRGFSSTLLRALKRHGVDPSTLRIEVPGSSVHRQSNQLTEYRELIDSGVHLRLNEVAEELNAQQISRDLAKILNANLESTELRSDFSSYAPSQAAHITD